MATLILTAVGTAVGGPIGGAIGAVIGQRVDAAIFAPKAMRGPRLGELAVQTSSYGTMIPKIFGTMRVAGTVIWATDLREEKATSGGGKGKPKTTEYSYSASFAVALSGRPIQGINRIWADGKLLRGLNGDFKSRTGYRLYTGDEGQIVDPFIASAEGIGQTPAFRGLAYAMFEDFELGDYGNRIPSLTFEVVAEAMPVPIGTIAEELSDGAITAGETPDLIGYAASGESVRGAVEALSDVATLFLIQGEGAQTITAEAGAPIFVSEAVTGAHSGDGKRKTEIVRRATSSIPDEVSIAYHDIARDFQTGLQRAGRSGAGRRSDRRALPAVLAADSAKSMAEHRLAALWQGRVTAKLHLPPRQSTIRPGSHVRIQGQTGIWKVERWTLEASGIVALELVRVRSGLLPGFSAADPGRPVAQPDLPIGSTVVHLLDLPLYEDQLSNRPRLFAIAAGTEQGWRRAALTASYDGGESWPDVGFTTGTAVMGRALTILQSAGSAILDRRNSVEVELLNPDMWLEARTEAALIAGANLAVLGNELIQFGEVEALGQERFRLSNLLRGRRGTEWAADVHAVDERFALIDPQAMAVIEPPSSFVGGQLRLQANGLGDDVEVETSLIVSGETTRPPSPVHLKAKRLESGDIVIDWVRRSRNGWTWLGDTPLGEEAEFYRILLSGEGFERVVTAIQPSLIYGLADQAADELSGPLNIEICQLGTVAASRAAQIIFS